MSALQETPARRGVLPKFRACIAILYSMPSHGTAVEKLSLRGKIGSQGVRVQDAEKGKPTGSDVQGVKRGSTRLNPIQCDKRNTMLDKIYQGGAQFEVLQTLTTMQIDFERQQFFWSRTVREGDHIIWTGAAVPRGYGIITIEGEEVYAHRVAYCLAHNLTLKDIEGLIILRTCTRNDCVDANHLVSKPKKIRKG